MFLRLVVFHAVKGHAVLNAAIYICLHLLYSGRFANQYECGKTIKIHNIKTMKEYKTLTSVKTASTVRLKWLDIARGLAFLMVIYSHIKYRDDMVMRYFSPMFLTMFFFVSGYLFKENCSFLKVFEQRTRTLLLPFLTLGGG